MDVEQVKQERDEIIRRFGPWTAHNIRLAGNLTTIDGQDEGSSNQLQRLMQFVADITREPFANLRVVDLGCLEGLYAIEFAQHGATVVGIEGRAPSITKARFAQKVLGLTNLEFAQDDVRNLSREKYGKFDVVLCVGILYHLSAPDVFSFAQKLSEVCVRLAIIDTHVSLASREHRTHRGKTYWGVTYHEHRPGATTEEKADALWASLDNEQSFWLTRPSLYNLLQDVGFTSVYECRNPPEINQPSDRITLLAVKGEPARVVSTPQVTPIPERRWAERQVRRVSVMNILRQKKFYPRLQRIKKLLT